MKIITRYAFTLTAALILTLWSIAAYAADWRHISSSHHLLTSFEVDVESLAYVENEAGEKVVTADGRMLKADKAIHFETWYVTLKHCKVGRGYLVTLTVDGKYVTSDPFLKDGGSVASIVADNLCQAHRLGERTKLGRPLWTLPQVPMPKTPSTKYMT